MSHLLYHSHTVATPQARGDDTKHSEARNRVEGHAKRCSLSASLVAATFELGALTLATAKRWVVMLRSAGSKTDSAAPTVSATYGAALQRCDFIVVGSETVTLCLC